MVRFHSLSEFGALKAKCFHKTEGFNAKAPEQIWPDPQNLKDLFKLSEREGVSYESESVIWKWQEKKIDILMW